MSESRQVDILSREEVFRKAVFRIEEARFRHRRFNGQMSEEITRLNLD